MEAIVLAQWATDSRYAGLSWSIDRDLVGEERVRAHATAANVARYLRDHPKPAMRREQPECLAVDPAMALAFLRWPNGSTGWFSFIELAAERVAIPLRLSRA